MTDTIKIICYLCPSIPYELFNIFSEELSRVLNLKVDIDYDPTSSGPMTCDNILDKYDMAFVCSPSYLTMMKCPNNKMELLHYNFVYNDKRNIDREPVYYSDIVVHNLDNDITMNNYTERNLIFGYNDLSSLSGYYSMIHELNNIGKNLSIFRKVVESGSHLKSIEMLNNKEIDIACIDSVCIDNFADLSNNLTKIGYFGPNPIQPILINSESIFKETIIKNFPRIETTKLTKFGVIEIKQIDKSIYYDEEMLMNELEN